VTRELVNRLIGAMAARGYPIRCTCTFRSIEEQEALYAQGRTVPGKIVTQARGGMSPHNHKMAADFIFVNEGYDGPWEVLRDEALKVGLQWGGAWRTFKDRPHVERKNWKKYVA
jgi:peptidoglycan L-alanyl-D-glutamate endopeptidase CwlK